MYYSSLIPRSHAAFVPLPGQSDLTSRFTATCINAVDWAMYGVETYTSEHARYFAKGVTMPSGVEYNPQAHAALFDAAFLRFLLHYFHKALQPRNTRVRWLCVRGRDEGGRGGGGEEMREGEEVGEKR